MTLNPRHMGHENMFFKCPGTSSYKGSTIRVLPALKAAGWSLMLFILYLEKKKKD